MNSKPQSKPVPSRLRSNRSSATISPVARVLLAVLAVYRRFLSAALHTLLGPGNGCRFEPSCSAYADEAIRTWGVWKGLGLATWRLLRCQPFSRGGWDPVPCRGHRHSHWADEIATEQGVKR